jgi:hypothetical protein
VTSGTDIARGLGESTNWSIAPALRGAFLIGRRVDMSKLSLALLGVSCALALAFGGAHAQTAHGVLERPQAQSELDRGALLLEQLQNAPQVVLMTSAPTPAEPSLPRFVVRAVSLYANQETDDWSPSDEIYAVFTPGLPDDKADRPGFSVRTSTFGDFDTGETKEFSDTQNCLVSAEQDDDGWHCTPYGRAGPFQFTVRLYEEDAVYDDLIGERTVHWSPEELAGAGLAVGGASEESIRIGGYTLTWRVERVS